MNESGTEYLRSVKRRKPQPTTTRRPDVRLAFTSVTPRRAVR